MMVEFGMFGGFNWFFGIFPVVFILMFVLVFGMFVVSIVGGIRTWNKNNNSPRLNVRVKVIGKRQDFRTHRHNHNHGNDHHMTSHTSTSTSHYVSFEVESGDRMELLVPSSEYGLLVEGDVGMLEFQGTRFLRFARER